MFSTRQYISRGLLLFLHDDIGRSTMAFVLQLNMSIFFVIYGLIWDSYFEHCASGQQLQYVYNLQVNIISDPPVRCPIRRDIYSGSDIDKIALGKRESIASNSSSIF